MTNVKELLTPKQVAEVFGKTKRLVNIWVALGCPTVREEPRLLDLDAVIAWRARRKARSRQSAK